KRMMTTREAVLENARQPRAQFCSRSLRRMRVALIAAVSALWCAGTFAAGAIEFYPTPDAAKAANPGDLRARVIVFGSQSCGWCRKLAADTLASPLIQEAANRFLWIKVDVDEHEDLAAQFGVRGLPHTVVADERDNVLGEQPGYLPPQPFLDFL